jgi:rhodanese-related sulfurtransferase
MLVSPAELVGRVKATIKECSVTDAQDCVASDTLLVDIREPAEFHRGHIPGAVHLPRGLLEFEIHGLVQNSMRDQNVAPEDRPIVLYCGTGGRSALAAETMATLGYRNVRSMSGGIVAWAQAKLPLDLPGQAPKPI